MFRHGCCVAILLAACSVFAAENANVFSLSPNVQRGDIYKPQGLWPLLGLGLGAMDSGGSARTGGLPSHVKVLGSYYFANAPVVADLGLGLHNEFLTQKGPGSDTIQSLYSELAGRYVFTNRWQLGAMWNTLVDNPDRYRSKTANLASFVGVQAMKEYSWKNEYLVRAGGRAMTSVGLNGGSVNTLMAELEVSFGSGHGTGLVQAEPPQVKPAPVAPHLAAQAMRTYNLEPKSVHFDASSSRLRHDSDLYFKRLARALADNQHLFDSVDVVGHADQRGTTPYNDKLSRRRAQAVAEKLIAAGVKTSQVKTEGRGKRELLSHSMKPAALLQNRRVQLQFRGVKDQAALESVVQAVSR